MDIDNDGLCVKLFHCGNRSIVNVEDNLEKHAHFMPMGLFGLAETCKKNGFDVEIIHSDLEVGKKIEEILDFNTLDAVGFDCHWVNQSLAVLNTAAAIKKIKPGVFVFLGGFTASFFAKEILSDYPYIDAVIRGDGEVPIVELCRRLHLKKNTNQFKHIPNLVWRNDNSELELNEISYVASGQDIDKLDFAEMSLLRNWEQYRDLSSFFSRFDSLNSVPRFILCIGRGCIYACSFCGGNNQAQQCINNRKEQNIRSLDSVLLTIKKAISYGYTFFYINFNFVNCEDYYMRLFNRIKAERLDVSISFGSWGIPSKAFIDALSDCSRQGVIEISPETSDHRLRKINKDIRLFYTNAEIEECLDYIGTKENLNAQLFFGYFLPFDTGETIFATLEFMEKIVFKYSHFTEVFYGNFSTDPASLLFFYPRKYEIDISVRCLQDYLIRIDQNYLAKEGGSPDITAFKPRNLTVKIVNSLSARIRLFNDLMFCFEKSINLLSKKVGKMNLISNYLREVAVSGSEESNFDLDEIKNILLNICKEHLVFEHEQEILTSIEKEYLDAKRPSATKLRQFYSYKSYNEELSGENEKENIEDKVKPKKIKFQKDETNFNFE